MEKDQVKTIASHVRIDRVMERIGLLAERARGLKGGVSRLAFTPVEGEAVRLVVGWMEDAGLTVSYDAVGNVFGSTDGNAEGAAVLGCGSHLDSVPDGGHLDGVLGVIGALEAVEAVRSAGFRPGTPMEMVIWRCEEAALFGQGRIGSLFYTGELSLDAIRRFGNPEVDLLARLEEAASLPQRARGRHFQGYLELHIEQGRRLDARGIPIGIVTAIPGATRWRITIQGRADHSGATPMGMRRDALSAAAELITAVERAGVEESKHESVATSAAIRVLPGAWNVIPGWAEVLTDIRGIDQSSIDRILQMVRDAVARISRERSVEISIEEVTRGVPVRLDEAMVSMVESTARALGLPAVRMPSGAGHDAQTIAPYSPTGMVFVPSIDGVSHAPEENTRPEDIEAGVKVLAAAWAQLAE